LAKPLGMQPMPELEPLPPWPCGHSSTAEPCAVGCGPSPPPTGSTNRVGNVESSLPTMLPNPNRRQGTDDTSPPQQQGNDALGLEASTHPIAKPPLPPTECDR
jgi:hypothetical protein